MKGCPFFIKIKTEEKEIQACIFYIKPIIHCNDCIFSYTIWKKIKDVNTYRKAKKDME